MLRNAFAERVFRILDTLEMVFDLKFKNLS